MPLIYQGSLNKTPRRRRLRFASARSASAAPAQSCRYANQLARPEVFGAVDELLSAGQPQFFGSMWQPMRTRPYFSKSHNGLVNSVADTSVSCA